MDLLHIVRQYLNECGVSKSENGIFALGILVGCVVAGGVVAGGVVVGAVVVGAVVEVVESINDRQSESSKTRF